jgi:hypothetical protein
MFTHRTEGEYDPNIIRQDALERLKGSIHEIPSQKVLNENTPVIGTGPNQTKAGSLTEQIKYDSQVLTYVTIGGLVVLFYYLSK